MSNVSKNFQNRPPEAAISIAMQTGGGSPSSSMYIPGKAAQSINFSNPGNAPVSKNFAAAAKAAKSADCVQNSATHRVLRGK